MDATVSALVSTLAALQETMAGLEEQIAAEKALQADVAETIKSLRSRETPTTTAGPVMLL